MSSHGKSATHKVLKPEDDWTKVKDPRQKKRIQNRVAQRTYRHRMKARMGELQARLEEQERSRLVRTDEQPARSVSHDAFNNTHFTSPLSQPTRALPNLNTNLYNHHAKSQSYSAYPPSGSPFDALPRAISLPPTSGLLSPPSQSERSSALTPEAMTCPDLTAPYPESAVLPFLDDLSAIPQISGAQSLPPAAAATVCSASPQLNEANPVHSDAAFQSGMPVFSSPSQMPTTLVDQGLGASSVWMDQSPSLISAPSNTRWDPWEGTDLQPRVLKAMESVIRVEGRSAEHDLLSKVAPLVEERDANGNYNMNTLSQMEEILRQNLPNAWTVAESIGANSGTTWRTEQTNVPLASMLLMNLAGQIPREKLLYLLGACL
ncbi:hypothetical protein LIA77_08871 [Sarocladium implicatum]|nr:hypothetical protein LIA77_08871 [Sarocladium implicatum]